MLKIRSPLLFFCETACRVGLTKMVKNLLIRFPCKRIDRNQWLHHEKNPYTFEMVASWEEMQEREPKYCARVSYTVEHITGRVLELGAGSGNVTRWMILKDEVLSVIAVEGFKEGFDWLRKANFPRVEPRNMKVEQLHFQAEERFDSVVISELIEHLYPDEEEKMLSSIRPHLASNARWIVSTPIGFLPDPHHVRGFEKDEFREHLNCLYGPVSEIDYSSEYSQVAWGFWKSSVR